MKDEIVKQVREVREQQAAKFHYDLRAIIAEARTRQKDSGRKVVSARRKAQSGKRKAQSGKRLAPRALRLAACAAGLVAYINPAMERQMTMEEIRAQFDEEWVLIEDPETDEALEVLSGRVVHHAKDRDEVYREAVARRPKRSAILFTGQIPEDTAVVL